MKLILPIALLCCVAFSGPAQNKWEYGESTGISNYLGEIGGKQNTRRDFILDMKLSRTGTSLGAFTRCKVRHNFFIKGALSWNRISGNDRLSSNPGLRGRNLSFRNDIAEMSITSQYAFFHRYHIGKNYQVNNNFMAYAFAGVAGFYHNPQAEYNGSWVALQPLRTEEQGISPEAPHLYSLFQPAVPAGTGFFFTMNRKYRIGAELNWRTTFTDYLDDVYSYYINLQFLSSWQ